MASPLLDLLLPHRCISCAKILAAEGALCTDCWNDIAFVSAPVCQCCGVPFELGEMEDLHCRDCLQKMPEFDRARSAFLYDEASRQLLLAFKHGDRTDLAPHLGRFMERLIRDLDPMPDLITPVPLHRWRLLRRQYNQAALLAENLAQASGLEYHSDLVRRHRATKSQGHLSPGARQRNLRNAFDIRARDHAYVADKHILLVDDVLTTGATLNACASTLKQAGAASVQAVTLARALPPGRN